MSRRGLLEGAYWFTMYTTFMAILALVFFVVENPQNSSSKDILKDANEGREILAKIATRSMAADRCTKTLTGLFTFLEKHQVRCAAQSRKRQASPAPGITSSQSVHEVPKKNSVPNGAPPKRASTYPNPPGASTLKRPSYPWGNDPYLQTGYAASTDGSVKVATPESTTSSSIPGFTNSPKPQLYGASRGSLDSTGLPDLTSMMFPTNDPFAYPNQPMTTLEATHFGNNGGADNFADMSQRQASGLMPSSPTGVPPQANFGDSSMDMQVFSMPPYLMQGHQPGMSMGFGLFDNENMGQTGVDDPWVALGKRENIDWGTWGEGNFGG